MVRVQVMAWWTVGALALAGCGEIKVPEQAGACSNVSDCDSKACKVASCPSGTCVYTDLECGAGQTCNPTSGVCEGGDTTSDVVDAGEIVEDVADAAEVGCSEFECTCTADGDCDSGLCVPDGDGGRVCGQACSDGTCPGGWACGIAFYSGVATKVCLRGAHLCRPCLDTAACLEAGAPEGSACVSLDPSDGSVGAFCGQPCQGDTDCPSGYVCETSIEVGTGTPVPQCVPGDGLACSCSPAAVEDAAGTACVDPDNDCDALRVCGSDGSVSACVAETSEEVCDGIDNDCDGITDPEGAPGCVDYFVDVDGDGFGEKGSTPTCLCAPKDDIRATEAGDCNDTEPEMNPGEIDLPDAAGIDANCDGADGMPASTVYVSSGAAGGDGSSDAPVATVTEGIALAVEEGKQLVLVSGGTYAEGPVVLANGVSVFGGLSLPAWTLEGEVTEIRTDKPFEGRLIGVRGGAIESPTVLGNVRVTTADAPATSTSISTYGVYCIGCPGLTLLDVEAVAGDAADGLNGIPGNKGQAGANGGSGGDCGTSPTSGGAPATGGCTVGGAGGAGGGPNAAGEDGLPSGCGGAGGAGSTGGVNPPGTGTEGCTGDKGAPGAPGAGANDPVGQIVNGFWVGDSGEKGKTGDPGAAGGGGGGAGGFIIPSTGAGFFGPGAGAGGNGGCGGGGGGSGGPGGGSFGVFLVSSNGAVLDGGTFQSGDGGKGGSGALGGTGGPFGKGGSGGTCNAPSGPLTAASGGDGGTGGDGGFGGGGAGGASYALVLVGTEAVKLAPPSLAPGSGGEAGGAPGAGSVGVPGESAAEKVLAP